MKSFRLMMQSIKKHGVYILSVFLYLIYMVSFLFPRDKNTWLFGSTFGHRFADNPKYFYLYVQKKKSDIRAIWISEDARIIDALRNKGYEAYNVLSFKGIFFALRGGVYIFDNYSKDISFWLSGGATKVNLWHGVPLKKICRDNKFDYVRNPRSYLEKMYYYFRRLQDERPSHYLLATSDEVADKFTSAFAIDIENILICGYPRNDILLSGVIKEYLLPEETTLYEQLVENKENQHKLAMYMPTFRESESVCLDILDLDKLNTKLAKKNIILITKLHPKSKLKNEFNRISYENIINIPAIYDPYPFLQISDILITDYSSIYFDFLLVDRPIIFFAYDLSTYISESRELYYDYNDATPGPKVYDMDGLINEIINSVNDPTQYHNERAMAMDKFFKYKDSNSSERLYAKIKSITGNYNT